MILLITKMKKHQFKREKKNGNAPGSIYGQTHAIQIPDRDMSPSPRYTGCASTVSLKPI